MPLAGILFLLLDLIMLIGVYLHQYLTQCSGVLEIKKKMFLVGWGAHLFGACIKRKLCICVYVHLHDCVIIIIFFLHTEI